MGVAGLLTAAANADDTLLPVTERFADASADETPDFQRHVVPLMGKLGCNGRACHGSFQGRGDFRLSLFGYDFEMDHEGLMERIDTDDPEESYALHKPTLQEPHEGGRRMDVDSWQYRVFLNWIRGGAEPRAEDAAALVELEVTPAEVHFSTDEQQQPLKAIAVWSDGTREDVTALCRYQSNDDLICAVEPDGVVSAGEVGDSHVVVFYDTAVVPIPVLRPVSDRTGDDYPLVDTTTEVDELVVNKLRHLGIIPSDVCNDADFLRRASLDITGTLPTADEVRQFLADGSADKRSRKIDELLETPAYAARWTTSFCDWTGNSDQQLANVSPVRTQPASQDWYDWIYERIADNVPYDDLVEGIVVAKSRNAGEDYRAYSERMSAMYHEGSEESFADLEGLTYYWSRRNFRQPEERAIGFAYTFMGTRIQCAQCHKHPFDVWTQDDFTEFQTFFTRATFNQNGPRNGPDREAYQQILKQLGLEGERGGQLRRAFSDKLKEGATVPFPELAVAPVRNSRNGQAPVQEAHLLGSESINVAELEDPRTALMDWLRNDDKQLLAKAFVNRTWANYFHRGIVEPTDDLSLANPPSNAPLLDHLTEGFVESGYDMKWLHREICHSDTYQRSWRPNETNVADERNFSRAVPRRLSAETALDALELATANDERAATFATDLNGRFIAIPGALRGNNGPAYALTIFGRSLRESNCDCERSSEASLLQTVFLRNDQDTLAKIDRRDGWVSQVTRQQGQQQGSDRQIANLERRIAQLRRNIQRAEQTNNKNQLQTFRRQIGQAREQLADLQPEPEPESREDLNAESLVEEAYLRMLSRFPSENEQEIAAAFINEADDPAEGIRGLVWSLINTKEFIVNH